MGSQNSALERARQLYVISSHQELNYPQIPNHNHAALALVLAKTRPRSVKPRIKPR